MRKVWVVCLLAGLLTEIRAQETIEVKMNIDKVEKHIDEKVYGFLLEHLYHSVSNGVWGENVWNRSFEELLAYGAWQVDNSGEVILNALGQPMADFRICRGRDYELNLEVKRIEGNGCVLIGMRDQNRDRMLTNRIYWYLGAENNTSHKLELSTGWVWHTPVVSSVIADSCSGMLKKGEWVKVRMRCKGSRLDGWISGEKVLERTVENCPMEGAVTLGGEDCRVIFRNIQVTSLNNAEISVNLNLIRHWNMVGKGSVETIGFDALNHNTALCLHSSDKYLGIEQVKNFSIRKDDLLGGSLFLKGTVNEARIQLLDEKTVVSEKTIQGISDVWKEFPVELSSRKDVAWGTLRIITEKTGDLYVDQVSLMHRSSIDNNGFRVELADAVNALQPAILRWPGGSFSEQYRFENGLGKQSERKGILRWDDFDPLSFGTDEFIAFCRKIGAEPQIVVPIGYHNYAGYTPDKDGKEDWLQRALDWIEYCNGDPVTTKWGKKRAENGHIEPYYVKYWEIDNEVWKMDPVLYSQLARLFSIEMKKKDPSIKIIGCGCGRLGREGAGLDSIMIHDVAEYIDYISPHYYQELNKYGNDGVEEYGRYLDQLAGWIKQSKNPDMKIYLSEWNLDGIDMRTGLFAGGFLNRLERTPGLEMAAPALFLRHMSATGWNNSFINFDQNGWFPAPNYVVFKLWREHFLPNLIELEGDINGLNIVATASNDKKQSCLKIVNPSGNLVMLKLKEGAQLGNSIWKMVNASSLDEANSMEFPDKIRVEQKAVIVEGENIVLALPAYSASVLVLEKE